MVPGDCAFGMLPQDPLEEPAGLLVDLGERGPPGGPALLLGVLGLELDSGVARQLLDRLAERLPLDLHDELDRVAARAAAEAMEHALVGIDAEAGRLLAVERAQPLEVSPRLLELDTTADDLRDVHAVAELLQLVVADHLIGGPAPPAPRSPGVLRRGSTRPGCGRPALRCASFAAALARERGLHGVA